MEHGLNIERTVSELHEVWRFDGSRALGPDFWQEMHKLARSTPADAASVTLDGGDQFGVGTDLAWLSRGLRRAERQGQSGALVELGQSARSAFDSLRRLGVPLFALCTGAVTGASAELASLADMRLCLGEARISLPEASLSMLPDFCSIPELVASLGGRDARRCLVLQEVVTASAAEPAPFFDSYPVSREAAMMKIREVSQVCARGAVLVELRQRLRGCGCGSAAEAAEWNEQRVSLQNLVSAVRTMAGE